MYENCSSNNEQDTFAFSHVICMRNQDTIFTFVTLSLLIECTLVTNVFKIKIPHFHFTLCRVTLLMTNMPAKFLTKGQPTSPLTLWKTF